MRRASGEESVDACCASVRPYFERSQQAASAERLSAAYMRLPQGVYVARSLLRGGSSVLGGDGSATRWQPRAGSMYNTACADRLPSPMRCTQPTQQPPRCAGVQLLATCSNKLTQRDICWLCDRLGLPPNQLQGED